MKLQYCMTKLLLINKCMSGVELGGGIKGKKPQPLDRKSVNTFNKTSKNSNPSKHHNFKVFPGACRDPPSFTHFPQKQDFFFCKFSRYSWIGVAKCFTIFYNFIGILENGLECASLTEDGSFYEQDSVNILFYFWNLILMMYAV